MCRRLLIHVLVLVLAFGLQPLAGAARDRSTDGLKRAWPVQARPTEGEKAAAIALRYLGTPYRWGGASPSGFDCSGFVMYVWGKLGVRLPHSTWMLWGEGRAVRRKWLEPGDIVFFAGHSHVGLYIGRGRFVHSPHTGDVVRIERLSEGWYRSTYDGARRVR